MKTNANGGAFIRPARLPVECRLARARMRGFNDALDGKPPRATESAWKRRAQFAYERGRMEGTLARVNAVRPLRHWKMAEHIDVALNRMCGHERAAMILEEGRGIVRSAKRRRKQRKGRK